MFGLSSRSHRDVVAVVDIGSSSAAVALVALESDKPAVILACHRTPVTIGDRTPEAMAAVIAAGLDDAATTAKKMLDDDRILKRVTTIYAFVHAPWTHSTVAHALRTFDADVRVTEDIIAALGKEALDASGRGSRDLFEASVVRVELNGYPTGSPVGKTAHRILASSLSSTCEPAIYRAVGDVLSQQFPSTRPVVWRSGARAVVAVSNTLSGKLNDSIIIEIGSEASTIIVVRRGVLAEEELLSEGMNALLRSLGGDSIQETLNVLHLIGQDLCESAACEDMNAALARVEPDLVRLFGERFAKLATERRLPSSIILLAHPDVQQWLSHFFARIDFTQFSVTAQPFSVTVLKPSALGHLVITEGKQDPDTSLHVAVACARIERDQDLDRNTHPLLPVH